MGSLCSNSIKVTELTANDEELKIIDADINNMGIADESVTIINKFEDDILLREMPLSQYLNILALYGKAKPKEQLPLRYDFSAIKDDALFNESINSFSLYQGFVKELLDEPVITNSKKYNETTRKKTERFMECVYKEIIEKTKRKNDNDTDLIFKHYLVPLGYLYCRARNIEKLKLFFIFLSQNYKLRYESYMSDFFFFPLIVASTFGIVRAICQERNIDYCKYFDDGNPDCYIEDAQNKDFIEYCRRFCSYNKINKYWGKMTYIMKGVTIEQLANKEIPPEDFNPTWDEFVKLYESQKIRYWYFSSSAMRKYLTEFK